MMPKTAVLVLLIGLLTGARAFWGEVRHRPRGHFGGDQEARKFGGPGEICGPAGPEGPGGPEFPDGRQGHVGPMGPGGPDEGVEPMMTYIYNFFAPPTCVMALLPGMQVVCDFIKFSQQCITNLSLQETLQNLSSVTDMYLHYGDPVKILAASSKEDLASDLRNCVLNGTGYLNSNGTFNTPALTTTLVAAANRSSNQNATFVQKIQDAADGCGSVTDLDQIGRFLLCVYDTCEYGP